MNPKTTLFLAVVLMVVIGLFWLAGGDQPADLTPPKAPTKLLEDTPLIAEDFGDPVKIVCRRQGDQAWTFERESDENETGQAQWRLTAPFEAQAAAWQVSGITRRLKQLSYQVKFAADGPGAVTPAQAGLEPPGVTVTLENAEGKSVAVEIGRQFAANQTYVRLAGSPDIYAVSASLDNLLKKEAIEYRDQQLLEFEAKQVRRLEITDRPDDGPAVGYVLVRSEAGWTFEEPIKAVAVKDKIDSAASTLAGLRVSGWIEAKAANLGMYGLDEAGLTVRVTVEEPPEEPEDKTGDQAEDDEEGKTEGETADGAEPEPEPEAEPVIRQFVVHVSRRSPIGEATKVYVRMDGQDAVGTIGKTLADRLTPDLGEWRDMRLTRVDVTKADSIELTTPQGKATFKKQQNKWVAADGGADVDAATVSELLNQIKDLKALSFSEISEGDAQAFGLDQPQASVRLNVPGQPRAERFVVGGYTDAQRRRMVYVRANDAEQVAKVRVADVDKLVRDPVEYRDRTVFDLKPDRFQRVAIQREDEIAGATFTFALATDGDHLRIAEPAPAATSDEQVKKLTTALGGLKATRVMPDADPSEYGLDNPAATCEITYRPPEITRYVEVAEDQSAEEPADDESEGTSPATEPTLEPEQYQPPDQTYKLLIARHDGKVYAMRQDRAVIYEVAQRVLNLLQAEYHQPAIFDFEASQVVGIVVSGAGGLTHELAKLDDQWRYTPEPELPIDPKRVQDLLLRLTDLKTERFATYATGDLGEYGLDAEPRASVAVRLEGGGEQRLIVSQQVCDRDPQKRYFAMLADTEQVFLVSDEMVKRFEINLEELEAP